MQASHLWRRRLSVVLISVVRSLRKLIVPGLAEIRQHIEIVLFQSNILAFDDAQALP